MEANIVRLVSVPFILMHMGRLVTTNGTIPVTSIDVIFASGCRTLCAAQIVVVGMAFSVILPDVFMGCMSADGADALTVFGMRDSLFFTATIADDIMKLVIRPHTLPVMGMLIITANSAGFRAVKGMILELGLTTSVTTEKMAVPTA